MDVRSNLSVSPSSCLGCRCSPVLTSQCLALLHNPAGAAVCLAAQSLFTVGRLLWSAGRAAMPAAGRRAADAAVALACSAAAAVALS